MIKRVDIQVVDLENIDVERKPIVDAFTRYETLAKKCFMANYLRTCDQQRERVLY